MSKQLISPFLSFVFLISVSVFIVGADNSYNLGGLGQCGQLFAYSGINCAYFYGFNDKTLYSSRVIPDCVNRYVSVSYKIRSVCHDESNAYALYGGSNDPLGVVRMNMNNGNCAYCSLGNTPKTSVRSFAVSGNEIFTIQNGSPYSVVKSFSFNAQALKTYSFSTSVESLFNNGGNAYAVTTSGEVFRISGGGKTKCADLGSHPQFTDAGAGYILTGDKRLVSLNNGNSERLSCDFAARTSKYTFTLSGSKLSYSGGEAEIQSAKMLCAAGSNAAVLKSDCSCEVINSADHTAKTNSSSSESGMKIVDGFVTGVEPEITVSQLKTKYPQIKKVLDSDHNEVTSGKVRTGYFAVLSGGEYGIAVRGDVNSSGTVNTADINELMTALSGAATLSPVCQKAADYNLDGSADTRDLVLIAKKINNS